MGTVRLGLPCIGLDNASRALRDLQVPGEVLWGFDVDDRLWGPLVDLHTRRGMKNIRLGKAGNVLRVDEANLPKVDLVVSGPPCPPWARMGKMGGEDKWVGRGDGRVDEVGHD